MSKRVHLDFGHGGKDPGALGNKIQEKDIVLAVGLEIGKILERHCLFVSYSRKTDIFLGLSDRVRLANANNVDVMVSIHCNAATTITGQGVETFRFKGSSIGLKLASAIQNSILSNKNLYTKDRGVKEATFTVLTSKAPAVLVELAFITNKQDSDILKTKQKELAEMVAKGILDYFGIKYNVIQDVGVRVLLDKKEVVLPGFLENGTNYIEVEKVIKKGNKNYISIREMAELVGYSVGWDDNKRIVTLERNKVI